MNNNDSTGKRFIQIGMISYTVCLLYWMFIGFGRTFYMDEMRYNIIPFKTIHQYAVYYEYFNSTTWIINIGGNIGVFMPFGLFLPYLLNLNYKRFISMFVIALFAVELLQMVSRRGSFDVDDIILNTLGASLGYVCFLLLKRIGLLGD